MARGINKVIIVGHLGGDPEMRYVPSGAGVATFSVAVSESWTDKSTGEQKERTEWFRCEAWQKLAEICSQYLSKGQQVYIEGSLRTEKYEKDGIERYATKVRVNTMQMLGGRGEGGGGQQRQQKPAAPPQQQDDFDDDIPF